MSQTFCQPITNQMERLEKLSVQELLDLNVAIQSELTRRMIALNDDNNKLKHDTIVIRDGRDVSVSSDNQIKSSKNPSWINTGKLKATANRFLFRNVESQPTLVKRVAHKDFIWDVRWNPSPDYRNIFASCSADGTVRIWRADKTNPKGFIPLQMYTGHTGSVNSVRFHPTQNIICTFSGDRSCHIWKPMDYRSVRDIPREEDEENAGNNRGSRRHLSLDVPVISKPLAKLISHEGYVTAGDWNADGSQLVSGSQDATIKVWQMSDWSKPLYTLTGHDNTITSIAMHPSNNNLFCSSSQDKTIRLWDTQTSSFMINVLHGHEKGVSNVIFDRYNPSILISGSDDCTVKMWDLKTLQCLRTIHTSYVVNRFCQSPEEEMLCLPSRNASAEIYSSQGVPLTILSGEGSGHNRMIYSCDWNETGILTSGLDRSLCLWDVNPNDS